MITTNEGVRPALVALARAAIESAVLAVIAVAVTALSDVDLGLGAWAPVAVLALRTLEGVADERIDPTRQRRLLGGKAVS